MKPFPILLLLFVFTQTALCQYHPVQQKAMVVKRMIELNHLSPRPVDDSFSNRFFTSIINRADERRLFFTDAEFKSLQAFSLKLDDELNGREWVFYNQFSAVYQQAIKRADSILLKLTAKPFDFTVNETVSTGKKDAFVFAADRPALIARWNRYLKFRALDALYDISSLDTSGKTGIKTVIAGNELRVREQLKKNEGRHLKRIQEHSTGVEGYIMELYLDALAGCFDPHTNYFSPQGKQEFQEQLSTEALSLGLDLDENEKGQITVDKLVPGGPAWKSGDLNKGDVLLSMHWEGKENKDLTGAGLQEAYEEMEKATDGKVIIKVQKADGTIKTTMLRKEKIQNEENVVKGFILEGEKKIGYILLPGFYTEWENETGSSCANDVAKEIVKLKKENIDGLILDVRYNGGGSVGEAMEMIGIFVDEGPEAGIKTKEPKLVYLKDPNRGTIYSGPMLLLVNGQSASASEMLAASLQDYNRAVIVGSPTFGKATMQQMFPLDTTIKKPTQHDLSRDMIKITTGKLYRLNGESAQKTGVLPDVVLPDAFDGIEYREKYKPNVLSSEPVAKNSYYKPLPVLPVADLAAKSAARIKADENFKDIQRIIALMIARRDKQETISLKTEEYEQWARQNDKELASLKGTGLASGKLFRTGNHAADKTSFTNNEYAREINLQWLDQIAEDIYIQEAFLVICDLIKLRTP
jgi:carboxyl-terminal processing protease